MVSPLPANAAQYRYTYQGYYQGLPVNVLTFSNTVSASYSKISAEAGWTEASTTNLGNTQDTQILIKEQHIVNTEMITELLGYITMTQILEQQKKLKRTLHMILELTPLKEYTLPSFMQAQTVLQLKSKNFTLQ